MEKLKTKGGEVIGQAMDTVCGGLRNETPTRP